MILSRADPHVLQVLEYGDAEIPPDMPQELRVFSVKLSALYDH